MRDDDDGQVDGDAQPFASPFARSMKAQPWVNATGQPPWHMWGNSQTIELFLPATESQVPAVKGQLTRIAYGRPETWNWLFTARVVSADDADVGEPLQISIVWELTVGIGRSMQQNLGFDSWAILWGNPPLFPSLVGPRTLLWSTTTFQTTIIRPIYGFDPLLQPRNEIREIVAQDIQLNVRAVLSSPVTPRANDKRAVLEIGAQWAPKTHIRPDWLLIDVPPEAQFPGGEVGAR